MRIKWTFDMLQREALRYKTRNEFQNGNYAAYQAAHRRKIIDELCKHMSYSCRPKYTLEELKIEALKYTNKVDFENNSGGPYNSALRQNLIGEICGHMQEKHHQWTEEEIQYEALKYNTRTDFYYNSSAYSAALRKGILNKICIHMKPSSSISSLEQNLLDAIKEKYPKACRFRDRKVKILNKSYITSLEIDIYIPSLQKGIEFDGKYWHSIPGLKRSHPNWPEKEIPNYHKIKDGYFLSKGIQILHVNEVDWIKDKKSCIAKCFEFLTT